MIKRGNRTYKKYFCSDTQTGDIVEQTILSSLSAKGDGKSYIDNINLCYQFYIDKNAEKAKRDCGMSCAECIQSLDR